MLFAIVDGKRCQVREAASCGPDAPVHRIVLSSDHDAWFDSGVFYRRTADGRWERCYPDGPGRYVTSPATVVLDWAEAAGR